MFTRLKCCSIRGNGGSHMCSLMNPRRACAARVMVLGGSCVCVCVCVCLSNPFRPLRVKVSPENDTNASSRQDKLAIFLKMLRSKVMASFAHFVGVRRSCIVATQCTGSPLERVQIYLPARAPFLLMNILMSTCRCVCKPFSSS